MRNVNRTLSFLFALLLAFPALAQDLVGKVVGVHDGDTLTLLTEKSGKKKTIKVRFHGIDAPESDQPFGQVAKQFSSKAVIGQQITVQVKDQDRYGRTVGVVLTPDGKNLNQALVKNGYAWWYQRYAPNDLTLKQLEAQAREAKVGLWAESRTAIAPWDWRQGKRSVLAAQPGQRSRRNAPPQAETIKVLTDSPPAEEGLTVWVNTRSGVYHMPGSRWYGTTRQGQYMLKKEADKAGYREARNGQ